MRCNPMHVLVVLWMLVFLGMSTTIQNAELAPAIHVTTTFEYCDTNCHHWPAVPPLQVKAVSSDKDIFKILFDCTAFPCRVKNNPGGYALAFALAGVIAERNPSMTFMIEGYCYSGCTIFADIARKQVCTLPHATFGFHQGYEFGHDQYGHETTARFVPAYSDDLAAFLATKGRLPTRGMMVLSSKEARRYWRPCDPKALAAK